MSASKAKLMQTFNVPDLISVTFILSFTIKSMGLTIFICLLVSESCVKDAKFRCRRIKSEIKCAYVFLWVYSDLIEDFVKNGHLPSS